MMARTRQTPHERAARALAGLGLCLVVAGFALVPGAAAQTGDPTPAPTRYTSIFDQAAPAQPQPTVAVPTTAPAQLPADGPGPSPSPEAPAAQPTRYMSIFDQAAPAAPATVTPSGGSAPPTTTPASGEPSAPPTRVPSVFDQPSGGSGESAPTGPTRVPSIFDQPQSGSAPSGPTRVPSVFDQPGATGGTGTGGSTRVPSIFDNAAPADAQAPAAAQPGAVTSIFDQPRADVIRYEGEEPPPAEYCLTCHENPFLQMTLPSGEVLSVTVDEEEYMASVHGQHGTEGYRCIRCHEGMNEYPHPAVEAQTARQLVIELSTSCSRCHPDMYNETRNDLHVAVLARGNENGATCADCHTGHAVERLRDETTNALLPGAAADSARMCASCHSEIYAQYEASVHGQSAATGSNDAATCADCHGAHSTQGPSTGPFRLFSPQTCRTCHADAELMAQYDISTDVFDTYVADFHGTTVAIFQRTSPDQPFNAPVCADCHGVHNIMAVESADSPVIKDNLVGTCQRCHPDASENFPAAWMSHYQPTFERTPVVAVANLAYTVAIPAIIGGLALFVASDVRRRRAEHEADNGKERDE